MCSLAILCGSIVAACSGTIETPTEEFPARQGSSAAEDDDGPTPPPRAPTPAPAAPVDNDPPPVASNDDPPAAPADDENDPPVDDEDPPAAGALSFEADIQPIFNSTCGPCHAGQGAGGNNIGDEDIETALEDAIRVEERVFARIEIGTMPPPCAGGVPGDPGCISEEDLADLEAWYDAGSPP